MSQKSPKELQRLIELLQRQVADLQRRLDELEQSTLVLKLEPWPKAASTRKTVRR